MKLMNGIIVMMALSLLLSNGFMYIGSSEQSNSFQDYVDGIDVSAWQEDINWQEVHADSIQFCFAKATEGVGWTDPYFYTNMNQGSESGVLMGAYHFATPTIDDAVDEANYFVSIAGSYISEGFLRPVLDLEQGSSLGASALSNWVHTWMQTVQDQTGVQPLIYVNSNYANYYLDNSVNEYDLWIAHWTYDPTQTPDIGVWESWDFWQYSDQGTIQGISGYVDLNVFNGTMTQLQSFVIGNTVYVDDDAASTWYDVTHVRTIQEGIDNASSGDKVFVYDGTYFENVLIHKTVDLIGEHRISTIIDGSLNGDVLTITADEVDIMNVSIQHSGQDMYQDIAVRISGNNCSFKDNIVAHSAIALYLSNSKNCTMENNMFYNCTNDIIIDEVLNSTFKSNIITDCRKMFLIDSDNNVIAHNQIINTSSGFYVKSSSYNTIIGNDLSSNGNEFYAGFGLLLEGSSCFNLIKLNHIYNNMDEGVWLYSGSNNNTIKNNFISSNMIGVFFGNGIVNNKVYHNNFFNNIQYNARDYGMNVWDNGYSSGGNYWDDYTGNDGDNDGIGDTAYDILGGSNQDIYPFMNEDGWIEVNINQSIFDRGYRMMPGWDASQEFTPTLSTLSSVNLYMSKFGVPTGNVTVQICNGSADGTVLTEIELLPDEVPSFPDYEWVTIDIDDITVTPGETYFIVLKDAQGSDTHNCVQWGWCDSYPSGSGGPYDGGWFWFRKEFNPTWSPIRDWDYTFRTFGYE